MRVPQLTGFFSMSHRMAQCWFCNIWDSLLTRVNTELDQNSEHYLARSLSNALNFIPKIFRGKCLNPFYYSMVVEARNLVHGINVVPTQHAQPWPAMMIHEILWPVRSSRMPFTPIAELRLLRFTLSTRKHPCLIRTHWMGNHQIWVRPIL